MHTCVYPTSANGRTIIVAYLPVRGGSRQHYLACSFCDAVDVWPNFVRTSPSPKEKQET